MLHLPRRSTRIPFKNVMIKSSSSIPLPANLRSLVKSNSYSLVLVLCLKCSKAFFFWCKTSLEKYLLSNTLTKFKYVRSRGSWWVNRTPSHHASASPRRYNSAILRQIRNGNLIVYKHRISLCFQSWETVASTVTPKWFNLQICQIERPVMSQSHSISPCCCIST